MSYHTLTSTHGQFYGGSSQLAQRTIYWLKRLPQWNRNDCVGWKPANDMFSLSLSQQNLTFTYGWFRQ
jgi:hypothetical protein